MERVDTIIPVRMSLSVRAIPSQLESACTVDGQEFRTAVPLFSDKLLNGHRIEVNLAIDGVPASNPVRPAVLHGLRRTIPCGFLQP